MSDPIRTFRDATLTLLDTPDGLLVEGEVGGPTLDGVPVTAERAAEARAKVRTYTVEYEAGDFSWTPEEPPPHAVTGSFTSTTRDIGPTPPFSALCDLLRESVPPAVPTYTLTLTYTRSNPSISDLRRWARANSATRWRCRSIASWRHAWRVREGTGTVTMNQVTFGVGASSADSLTVVAIVHGTPGE